MPKKISDLTELTSAADDDFFEIVDASETNVNLKNKRVLVSTLKSLFSQGGAGFDAWNIATTYTGGETYFVSHESNIWQFISATDDTGTEPGTDNTIWLITSAGQFTHQRNKDTYLAFGTGDQIAASDIPNKNGSEVITGVWYYNSGIDVATGAVNIGITTATSVVIGRAGAGSVALTATNINLNGVANVGGTLNASGTVNFAALTASTVLELDASKNVVSGIRGKLSEYTVATLPSAETAGIMIYVSDESGGAVPAFSDGTNWRRVTDRNIVS